ncbi:MAG TPA: site-specific integrase [Candidatus Polarisedimenticolaceae bacterium]|nr:site-specific integrase [Candidatus Polarisedimenticolaceae bacterium]
MAIKARTLKRTGITVYDIDFRDQDGDRVREAAGTTMTQAKSLLTKRKGQVLDGTYRNPKKEARKAEEAKGPTFAEFADRFIREYASARRSDYYEQRLRPAIEPAPGVKEKRAGPLRRELGARYMREFRPADFDAFRLERSNASYQGRQLSASTVRKDLTLLSTMFKLAKRWGVIDTNPAADVEKPKEPEPQGRPLSTEEWGKVAAQLTPTLRALSLFALAAGARLQEAVRLRWSDVDTRGGFIYFSAESKMARSKRVKLGEAAKAVLADMERVRKEVARATSSVPEFVFVYPNGGTLHSKRERNRVSQRWRDAAETAGMPWASFKSLRTTAASWAEEEGIPVGETKALLGHADVRTTQRFYVRSDADRTANVVSALDRRLVSGVDTQVDTRPETPSSEATARA